MITLHESTIHVAFTVFIAVCKLTPNDSALLLNPGPVQRIFRTGEKSNKRTLKKKIMMSSRLGSKLVFKTRILGMPQIFVPKCACRDPMDIFLVSFNTSEWRGFYLGQLWCFIMGWLTKLTNNTRNVNFKYLYSVNSNFFLSKTRLIQYYKYYP